MITAVHGRLPVSTSNLGLLLGGTTSAAAAAPDAAGNRRRRDSDTSSLVESLWISYPSAAKSSIMVRGRDACWEHCVLVDATRQKVRCNYCHREFSGGVYRMKFHLAQIKNKDIVPCSEVPDDVRNLIHSILITPRKQKAPKKSKIDPTANGPQHSSSSASGYNAKNAGSSGQHGSTCPSLLLPLPPPDDAQKQKYDNADNKIALFFFHNSIPFSASKSIYYQAMVDAIADCGAGYKPPTYEGLRSTLLEKIKEEINENYRKLKDEWKDTGCTILSDSWSDGRSKSLLVLSVASPKGTQFLKLLDISSHADDAYYLFELLDSVIVEVGAENVVQVITDSATSYAYAAGLLLKKYPSLFWFPCASYCIEKMLEDISKLEWVSTTLEETRTIARRSDALAIKSLLYLERFWKSAHEIIGMSEPLLKLLSFKFDVNMRNGFHAAMWKMFPEENDRIELIKDQPVYIKAQGALGSKFAIMGRTLNSPGDWWTTYGYEIPVLQRAAVRILSQPCSSYWFKWNWSTFENIYTKNHTRMEMEKLNDLVFVHCNLRLQEISQNRGAKCRPVTYDEIDVSSELKSIVVGISTLPTVVVRGKRTLFIFRMPDAGMLILLFNTGVTVGGIEIARCFLSEVNFDAKRKHNVEIIF
ncbi:hypothetical protein OPV22_013686 [Ensete ventricosum]|uniref:BED-type domain-containing protein n=1 Tax=Ensete ventricosum TaxID=4639 RepID=A0AAV8R8V9_ENSVE|nr:hypothetical protein OPV22_013686 [Ensete ventricosum]